MWSGPDCSTNGIDLLLFVYCIFFYFCFISLFFLFAFFSFWLSLFCSFLISGTLPIIVVLNNGSGIDIGITPNNQTQDQVKFNILIQLIQEVDQNDNILFVRTRG